MCVISCSSIPFIQTVECKLIFWHKTFRFGFMHLESYFGYMVNSFCQIISLFMFFSIVYPAKTWLVLCLHWLVSLPKLDSCYICFDLLACQSLTCIKFALICQLLSSWSVWYFGQRVDNLFYSYYWTKVLRNCENIIVKNVTQWSTVGMFRYTLQYSQGLKETLTIGISWSQGRYIVLGHTFTMHACIWVRHI